jgi:L1 cell adhesion molecule like protein
LSAEDIEKMLADAEKFKDEDAKVMLLLEAKNKLETYVYSTDGMLNDEKMKVPDDTKEPVKSKIDEIKSWLNSEHDEPEEYDAKYRELEEVAKPIFDEMMKQNMPPGMPDMPPGMPDMTGGMPNVPEEPEDEPKIEEID